MLELEKRWYSGESILSGHWRRHEVSAERRVPRSTPATKPAGRSIDIPGVFQVDQLYRVASSEAIAEGESFAVQFQNKRIMILRTKGVLRAFSANCPHGKYRMDDGFHDSCAMICPGHGLEFDVQTGQSALKRYRLAAFQVFERDGMVYLGRQS